METRQPAGPNQGHLERNPGAWIPSPNFPHILPAVFSLERIQRCLLKKIRGLCLKIN